jgi:sortase B
MFLRQTLQEQADKAAYEEAAELVSVPDLPEASEEELTLPSGDALTQETGATGTPEEQLASEEQKAIRKDAYAQSLNSMDLGALQALNPESIGWILIPNTKISYPLMQSGDNEYYLKHNYKKAASAGGSIFLDYRNAKGLKDFNSIIYGHRMKNGTMFEALKNYARLDYWKKHPYIYITLPGGTSYQYTIFASYEESASGQSYRTNFGGDLKAKQAFLDHAVGASLIATGVSVSAKDQILTLSTCTGRGYETRLVVHAKRTGGAAPEITTGAQETSQEVSQETPIPESEARSQKLPVEQKEGQEETD